MDNFTTNNYEMKRDIINFSKKICNGASKPESKFTMDMIYGISKSKDILLSSIAGSLDEDTKKAYTINRLSDNLSNDLSSSIDENYCNLAMDSLGENPVFLIDDSDIIKPLGEKFEDLGIVRDGSSRNKSYEKGYHHTEIVGLTKNKKQPISLFSKIHSSTQKEFVSANDITFEGIDKIVNLLNKRKQKGIFVNDRGYDNNLFFNHYFEKNQYFVIRLKINAKHLLDKYGFTFEDFTFNPNTFLFGNGSIEIELINSGEAVAYDNGAEISRTSIDDLNDEFFESLNI